jgi:hypothetical protein
VNRRGKKKAPSGAAPEGAKSEWQSGPSRRAAERDDDNDHEDEAEGGKNRGAGRLHERALRKRAAAQMSRFQAGRVEMVRMAGRAPIAAAFAPRSKSEYLKLL